MKVALVKQVLDIFGPWCSVRWSETSPSKLFDVWPSKAVYWELTCMLQADWYIIPQARESDYTRDAVGRHPGRAAIIEKYTSNITAPREIPLHEYDIVLAFDAVLDVPEKCSTLFAYFAQEHWDTLYSRSLHQPVKGYDLFLAHMLDSQSSLHSLPQAVSFPYLHDIDLARKVFATEKRASVWVDWRTLMTLAMKDLSDPWTSAAEVATLRLEDALGIEIAQRGRHHMQSYGFADPPNWGDARSYLEQLAACQYYVGVGQIAGAGQGLAEAAAVGCICIGQQDKAYHRLICHPSCLCEDIAEMPARLRAAAGSEAMQSEILAWQDEALRERFERQPLRLLHQAIEVKRTQAGLR